MSDPIILRTPDGNACSFWWDTAKNEFASKSAGRPIFDKVLKMKVFTPGNRDSQPHFDIERHFADGSIKKYNGETKGQNGQLLRGPWRDIMADQLKAWEMQTGDAGALNGTPLTEWPRIDIAMAANLRAIGIHTVEALAEVTDGNVQNLGHGGMALRDQAKTFLAKAAGNAEAERLAAVNAEKDAVIADLQRQISALAAKLEAPTETKRGPGRPKQAQAA